MDSAKYDLASQLKVDAPWQRLSPIAILYFVMQIARNALGNIVYLIPIFAYSYSSMREHPLIWLPTIAVLSILLLLGAFWSFQVYRFRLSNKVVEIRSGIFSKKHLNLPFERIQNVKIEQPIYYRVTGFACLQLDTAGSAKQEAKLVALPLMLAEQLKQQILDNTPEHNEAPNSASADGLAEIVQPSSVNNEQIINRRSLADLILHGITNNRIWLFLGGLAPFYDDITGKINQGMMTYGVNFKEMFSLQTHSVMQVGLYALSLTLTIMFILMLFSVIGAIVSFYGYTLSKVEGRYIRRSGLFTKHEVSMPLSRLQLVIQKQDWLDVILKRVNLRLEQINAQVKQPDSSAANSKIIVPSITSQQSQDLIKDMYPNNQLFNIAFLPISGFYLLRYIGYFLLPLFCIFASTTIIKHNWAAAALGLGLFLLSSACIYLRWRRWGVAFDEQYVYIRRGLIGTDYYCFPAYKVQQSQLKQSVMMKKRQLASVKLILASGSVTVPLLSEAMAYKLINSCLYKVESNRISWM
ncbi:PH domain-containing protein [Paraglaciecola sp.]|uniref:PH domain-containing protein n=1 Tax=Paraglaciecola sp. TaxID=1920173 RepID=UPI0030F3834E